MSTTMESNTTPADDVALEARHVEAESQVRVYHYEKPDAERAKARVRLGKTDLVSAAVQIVKKDGGENNLHFHTMIDTFWMVLKGRCRFYGPGDELIGELGPMEGTITPRYARYWFENAGDEELELLQVAASARPGDSTPMGGRTDAAPQRFKVGTTERFTAEKS
ncbi:MAG: cupin domain-containing protein [Alphaproteobacteria bacterium]